MSLISCPKCHSPISDEAENCPCCGYPISPMAKLRSGIQLIKHKKRIADVQSVYAWTIMVIGFFLIVALPLESMEGTVSRALGALFIIGGMVWNVIIGLERWWSH